MSSKSDPTIGSCGTGWQMAYFDICQLTIRGMPEIKDLAMVMVLLSYFPRYMYWYTDGCMDVCTSDGQSPDNPNFLLKLKFYQIF